MMKSSIFFFWMLTIENENVLYIEPSSMLVYSKVRKTSLRLLWKGENIADKLFVIVPWNVNENHWTFIAADIRNKEIIFIDPMEDKQETSVTTALQPYVALSWVLNTKLGSEFNWKLTFPSHALQQDAISCGVFVCLYTYQMILKINVDTDMDTGTFRRFIYQKVAGTCLNNVKADRLDLCIVCKTDHGDQWVMCQRCGQWYHCHCVDISLQEANSLEIFMCSDS